MKDASGSFPAHNLCVKIRSIGLALILLTAIPFFLFRATGDRLLLDTDTNFLIFKLNEYNDPLRWFTHDWPLENHFYRPISTLVFELDNRLHPGNGSAFGLTNAILCFLSVLGLYWLVCELRRNVIEAVAVSWLWASWLLNGWFLGRWWMWVAQAIPWLILAGVAARMVADKKWRWSSIWVIFASFYVTLQLLPGYPSLSAHTLSWLPGRTATTMTVFAFVAFAAYVRYERLKGREVTAVPGPLDPPATRSATEVAQPKNSVGWLLLSYVATALALGSYEQAVMIPLAMFLLGVWLRVEGYKARFANHIWFWALLIAYVIYRIQIIPPQASGYQKQQFRDGPGVLLDLFSYVFPGGLSFRAAITALSSGPFILLSETVWSNVSFTISNIATWWTLRKQWILPALCILLGVVLFGPMAFLKQFGHYHFMPSAFMAMGVVMMVVNVYKVAFTAMLPQAIQAPQRSDRAPGSLPHL